MMKKAANKLVKLIMIKRGYSPYFALSAFRKRWEDFSNNPTTTWRQKIWAQRRGFNSSKISLYGLTEENYRDYVADFAYLKMHPINGAYSHWIDDKLTIRYLLAPFKEYLPDYYCQISEGQVLPLPDAPASFTADIQGILALLEEGRELAVKPMAASKGEGFYKISFDGQNYLINNSVRQRAEIEKLFKQLQNYLVTEYLHAHETVARIYPDAANSVRVHIINESGSDPLAACAFIKFGTAKSGVVDNTSAGGVMAEVDIESGRFYNGLVFSEFNTVSCLRHPDTGEEITGTLPYWELVKDQLLKISLYLPQLKYLGYDIVITQDSFKIIEINSHPGIGNQCYHPFLKDSLSADFFRKLLEKIS